jgi:hypothetical protein
MLGLAVAGIPSLTLATHAARAAWHSQDISGVLPPIDLSMMDATIGKPVTASDFHGMIVLLYFGYTQCPDFCPTTLTDLAEVLGKLGALANQARVLFVTVDPNRDSPDALKAYVKLFAPQIVVAAEADVVQRSRRGRRNRDGKRFERWRHCPPISPSFPLSVTAKLLKRLAIGSGLRPGRSHVI